MAEVVLVKTDLQVAEEIPLADDVRELVERCLQGDSAATIELVDRFRGMVFGLCYRMLAHRQDAEDVTQESFVRVFRNLHRWDPTREFRPWLLAIAGNRCRSLLATRKRRPQPVDLVDQWPDRGGDLQDARNLAEELRRALAGLRDEYRQAFLLFHEQHLSYAEISVALDCPLGTVKTWVHRARRELGEVLRARGAVEELRP
jgi:RNA polymerase sigma-70 factor (ECF subfamily)